MHSKIFLCIVLSVIVFVDCQLHFQEEDTNNAHKPQTHMRKPVTSSKCQEGELLYPGDNDGDWACDCRPTFLYYPQNGRCYEAFTRGPCNQNEILVLPRGKYIPICTRNPCEVGKVRYLNVCAKIGTYEGCKQPSSKTKTHLLQVNATTLQLDCVFATSVRGPELINEEEGYWEGEPACFLGSKRAQENTCS